MKTTGNIKEQTEAIFKRRIKRRSDKLINYFLVTYFLGGLVFASFYDTWEVALCIGGLSLIAYYSVKAILPHGELYQYVLSAVLGVFMAQYIYQMHGMFEMHFFAFIGSAILITYQNWKLQIPILAVVAIHHLAFAYLQNSGAKNVYFTQLNSFETITFIIHIVLAATIFFICGLWSYLLKKYSHVQIGQMKEMERLQMEALLAVKEQAAIESNIRFHYAAQATSDAIWDRNYSEDEVFWGDGYRNLFGYAIRPETTSISFWASKVHPDDLERITKITQDAKDNPRINSWSGEYRFMKANGEYAFVREKAIILRDDDGVPSRTIGALQDITEIKQNETELKQLNESLEKEKYYLDSLMDNMPDAIYFKDKDSNFLRVSKYMVKKHSGNHSDSSTNDLIGKSDFDIKDKKHAEEAFRDEQEIQETKKPKIDYIEKELKTDGTERWMATTKLPLINTTGEVVGTFGISRDITKVKLLEKQQHEAQLDKAVAQGKFEIASDVMHDIGNAVVGFGSYLNRIRRLQEKDNAESLQQLSDFFEQRKSAITAAIGADKAEAVIKMLSGIAHTQLNNQREIASTLAEQQSIISNIEEILSIQRQYISSHESKERKPANLKDIINDSLSMLNKTVDKQAIKIALSIDENLPLIKGDKTKLMQVVMNLLKNSMEAIQTDTGERTIYINAYTTVNKLVLEIKDNGIANPLQQINNCRAIIESHEGTIDFAPAESGNARLTRIGFKIQAA